MSTIVFWFNFLRQDAIDPCNRHSFLTPIDGLRLQYKHYQFTNYV